MADRDPMHCPNPDQMTILLALRLLGFASIEVIAARPDVTSDEETTSAILHDAQRSGWVVHRSGRTPGWMLLADGRVAGERALAVELDSAGVRPQVVDCYRAFVDFNPRALELCTRWQLRTIDGVSQPNDHDDPHHDGAVIRDLVRFVDEMQPTLNRLGEALDRFRHYADRLTFAAHQVRDGDGDYLTRPVVDSFHTVWFELHENLLATLGRRRSEERDPISVVDRSAG